MHSSNACKIDQAATKVRALGRPRISLRALTSLQAIEFWSLWHAEDSVREYGVREERDQDEKILASERAFETIMESGAASLHTVEDHDEGSADSG